MDSEHLLVPNNSRICNTPGDECSEARNSPIPTSFTSISFESRLSSTPSIKQYGSSPFQKFKRHCNTPVTTFDHDQAAAEKLKSRLYDRVENSDVYRRQPKVLPHPPPGSLPKGRPTMYRTTLPRKDKTKIKLVTDGVMESMRPQKKASNQVDKKQTTYGTRLRENDLPAVLRGSPGKRDDPTIEQSFGPDRFQGQDVLPVVQELRKRLRWETDPEIIVNYRDERVSKEESNHVKKTQVADEGFNMLEDDGQFAYAMLKNLDHPTARYNPYDLVCVGSAQARNLKQMFTVTASAVTQQRENANVDLTPMARWLYERKMFSKMFEIPIFVKFRLWKAFTTWKTNVRVNINSGSRKTLSDTLFIVDSTLQLSLLKVRRLCEETCSSLQRKQARVFFVDANFTDTLTLKAFADSADSRAEFVNSQLKALRTSCIEIASQACQEVIARYEGLSQWIRSERGYEAAKPTFTQIAQWKAVLGKLSKFVRSVDFVVLELLRRLVVTAANTLLAKVQASAAEQYPCQQDVGEGSKTCDERDESSPPAILTIQLVLGMHEPGWSHEANSTLEKDERHIHQDVTDSVQSTLLKGFVDLKPSEEDYVTVMRRVVSKFEEVVSCFKSLLTDPRVRALVTPPYTDLVHALTRNEEEETSAVLESWPDTELIFGEDPGYKDIINKLIIVVRKEICRVRDFSEKYKHFCNMVDVCRTVDVDSSVKKRTWTYDEFHAALTRHVDQVRTMEEMVVAQRVGIFLIQADCFRDSCVPYPSQVLRGVHYHLPIVAAKSNNILATVIKHYSKSLEKYPESVEEFMVRLNMLARVTRELPQLEQEHVKVTRLYSLATHFGVMFDPEEMAFYKTLTPSFHHLKSTMLYCEAKKDENILKFSHDLEILIGEVHEELVELKNNIRAPNLIDPSNNPVQVSETLKRLGEQLKQISTNARNYARYQDHFRGALSRASRRKALFTSIISSDDATKVDLAGSLQSNVAEVERDLSLRRLLWESSQQWSHLVKTWKEQPFESLNVEEMQTNVGKLIQTIYLLEKGLPANDLVSDLKRQVTRFKQGMPAVTSLRNPSLRWRHWEAVQNVMHKVFVRDENFTLGTLLEMNVFQYKIEIAEISSNASNEYSLEQMLRKVIGLWDRTDFNLTAHPSRDIFIIHGADEIITALEDSLVTITNIKGSRFVTPIKTLVDEWDRKLVLFSLTLEEWLTCQRYWLYLESIFTASDIQRQLPNETRQFGQVDRSWRDIMRRTADRPNALRSATVPGVLEILQACNTQLENIHRGLEDYLETKRLAFARFYFLSNEELLDILSNSKNPHSIQPHLKKCFSNVRKLGIIQGPAGGLQVHDMVSAEEECVVLQKPVRIRGAVESWLTTVERGINGVIKLYLNEALSRSHQEFTRWVMEHPGQVVLTASQILFCRNVIGCMESKDVDESFRDLRQHHLSTLNELVGLVMSPLLSYQRQSVEALLTIKVHERDTLQTLIEDEVHDQDDFQWKRQLRYRWDEANNTCHVLQHYASCEYGYEYLGCSPRLVITPLTDRCYLTLTGALHLHLGGAPFGPAGTGKTETVKDLAKAMGKQCVVFNCSEGLDYKMTGKFFSGVAQSACWFCFDEFNRIDVEVLSVIAQQLHMIKRAKDLESTWFVFEGRDIKLCRSCGVFITMNPGYAGRVELPDNVKSLFRPVAMMLPDCVLIAEIILFSEGFLTAVSLSRKVVNLYELISKQLSQQDHYDFGLRSIKSMLLLAGKYKRTSQRSPSDESSVEKHEACLLVKAIRSTNLPKFVIEDVPVFEQILVDLFPGLMTPLSDERIFQKAIDLSLEELSLQRCSSQVEKVSHCYENLLSRCGMALVGPTGGGKTTIRRILKEALSFVPILRILEQKYLESKGKADAEITESITNMSKSQITKSKYVIGKKTPVHIATINPKCVNLSQLYGKFNSSTMEWTDGLLSVTFRKFSKESNAGAFASSDRVNSFSGESDKLAPVENGESPTKPPVNAARPTSSGLQLPSSWYWLVLDGPVDAVWVENLNTVLDDTKFLCLANGERISVGPGMRIIFEVDNLAKASPATVGRCAMVFVDPRDLGWKPYVKAWLEKIKIEHSIPQDGCDCLKSLFDYSLDEGLRFQRTHGGNRSIESPEMSTVASLCSILAALLRYRSKDENQSSAVVASSSSNRLDPSDSTDSLSAPASSPLNNLLSKLFLFAFTWAVGGRYVTPSDDKDSSDVPSGSDYDLETSRDHDEQGKNYRDIFDSFVRNHFRDHPSLEPILPPVNFTVFDYFLNLNTEQFMLWQSLVPKPDVLIQKTLTRSIAITDSLSVLDDPPPLADEPDVVRNQVPTVDTIRYGFLLSLLLMDGHPVLLTGEVGVGKTVLVEDVLLRLSQNMGAGTGPGTILGGVLRSGGPNMSESLIELGRASPGNFPSVLYSSMQFSARLGPSQVQSLITSKLVKKGRDVLGAQQGSKVLVFMDDLNMPQPDQFGSQPPLELVREYLDCGGFHDTQRLQWIDVGDATVVAACGPPTGGRHVINPRILRHFRFLFLPHPSVKTLHRIFHVRLGRHLQGHDFMQEVRDMGQDLVFATLSVFFVISSKLLPTPAKSLYTFNLKDVNKVIEGLLQAHCLTTTTRENTALLFAHEATRVFYDRLTNQEDRSFFYKVLADKLDFCLRFRIPATTLHEKPLIFGDFAEVSSPKTERIYCQIKDVNLLSRTLQEYLGRVSLPGESLDQHFVFFRQAVEHISRAARVFRQPSGHLLLVGVGGSGKKTVVKLASYLEQCDFKALRSSCHYHIGDFRDDVKIAFYNAGIEGNQTVLFINDKNLVKESFLEDVSCWLNGREVPNMFSNEDKERIFLNLRKIGSELGVLDDKHAIFELFKTRVNQNIHIAISTSPSGTLFRQRCRVYPSLINCCTIDWYDEWPGDALESVGKAFLQSTKLADSEEETAHLIEMLTKFLVDVHRSCQEAANRFLKELKWPCYATPSTYIECIQVFKAIFAKKQQENIKYKERLSAGVLKLDQAYELVGNMQQELVELGPKLEQKTMDAENLLKQLAKDQESVNQVRNMVSEEESVMNREAKRVQDIADDAQKDLDQALPALVAANEELNALDKSDIAEVRVYTKPPAMVVTVLAAVCTILEEKTDWANMKQILADPGFLKRLINFDKNNLSDLLLTKLKRFTNHPNFQPDHVGRISVACRSMCKWTIALGNYVEIFRVVQPKKARCEEAFAALAIAKKNLDQKQLALAKIEEQLQILRQQYQNSVSDLDSLHQRKLLTTQRLERASLLAKAFSEEQDRWLSSVKKLDANSSGVIGDSFLSGAAIAYLGAFSQTFRAQLISQWYQLCQSRGIPISANFDFVQFLTKPVEIKKWQSNHLPQDKNSIQSAVLVKNSRKWPLLIDPQRQALKWIAEMEKTNGLRTVKTAQHNCFSTLEEGIQLGKPVVITEIGEMLDPRLEPVLHLRTGCRGNQQVVKISNVEVEYNENFRLYLATPLSNPHFFPEVFNLVTVINFTVTFEGLQDQLLSRVVYEERPELENKYVRLIENLVNDRYKIRDLEDKCLDLLNASKGNILDDEELVRTLEDSKNTVDMIQQKVEQSEVAQLEIRSTREHYLPVATRGAVIYFTLVDLPSLDVMYQFSLQWFVELFVSCLLGLQSRGIEDLNRATSPLLGTFQAGTVQPLHRIAKRYLIQSAASRTYIPDHSIRSKDENGLEAHLNQLISVTTETVYRRVSYGLFATHRIIFSFLLCCNILKHERKNGAGKESIEKTEWNLFIWGGEALAFTERLVPEKEDASFGTPTYAKGTTGTQVSRMTKPPVKWITLAMWQECMQLSSLLPAFSGLCSHISANSQYWLDFSKSDNPYEFLSLPTKNIQESQELQSHLSDGEHFGWRCERLSRFQRLMLVKVLRSECLLDSVRAFVKDHLGVLFVSEPPVDLQEIYKESDPRVPLIFILSPGSDPASQLMRFSRDIRGNAGQLDMISLGRGQEARAEETVTKGYKHRGPWVFLQNCHLASSFMPRLKELIRRIADPAVSVEPSFRLWLSSAPHKDFPVSILQAGTKLTVESSPGIKANILQSFATVGGAVSAAVFEDPNPGPYWKKLLFGLCLFNAVVHERKKFGPLGWNIPYDFAHADLEVSISMLRMLLTEHEDVPWSALTYLTAEVTYGGRVTDVWDQRCINNIIEKFYSPETLEDGYCYSSSKLYRPPSIHMTFSECCDYIESLPSVDHPELFGLQSEANRFCMQNEAKRLMDYLILVHPHVDSVARSGKTNDEVVLDLVSEIKAFLPQQIGSPVDDERLVVTQKCHRVRAYSPSVVSSPSPYDDEGASSAMITVLNHEVYRFNRLLDVIHISLNSLQQSINGQVLLSIDIEETYKSLLHNQVPREWQKVAYPSSKPLASWINNLVQRTNFFSQWLDSVNLSILSQDIEKPAQHMFRSPNMPRAFWISAFFFPQGFFTSVLQRHAQLHHVPVDSLKFHYEVTNDGWFPEDLSNDRDLDVNSVAFQGSTTEDCVRIFGLYLDGASWEPLNSCLAECRVDERFSSLPEVKVLPVLNIEPSSPMPPSSDGEKSDTEVYFYDCPVYSTPLRGDSFILAVHLPTHRPPQYWVTRGVALVSQLPE